MKVVKYFGAFALQIQTNDSTGKLPPTQTPFYNLTMSTKIGIYF